MLQLFIKSIGMQKVLLITLAVLSLFGGKKIPKLMKGVGKKSPLIQRRNEQYRERHRRKTGKKE